MEPLEAREVSSRGGVRGEQSRSSSSALERLSTKPAVKQPPRVSSKQDRAAGVMRARRSMACLISVRPGTPEGAMMSSEMRFSHRSRLELTVCDAERHIDYQQSGRSPHFVRNAPVYPKTNDEKNREASVL